MIVNITDEAKQFMAKKGAAATVKMKLFGGWAGCTLQPTVELGRPVNRDKYLTYEDNGATLYVDKSIKASEIKVYLRKGFFKGLAAIIN